MKSLKGYLLVASPSLLTPFFTRTVILMLEHNDEGALGVVLNRPTEATITDISEQVFSDPFEWDKSLHIGGPVPGPLLALHDRADLADQEVIDGVYSSIDAAKIRELVQQKAEPSLILANYAGWGPSQLEGEIEEGSWLSTPAEAAHVFRQEDEDLWETVVQSLNGSNLTDLLGLRVVPPDPNLN